MAKKKKDPLLSQKIQIWIIILLVPIAITVYFFVYLAWKDLQSIPAFKEAIEETEEVLQLQVNFDLEIPLEYIPIYMAAGEKYGVPWTLLAAHHRVETRFSTMSTLVSPVGAEGHMQFMPCTFVGWKHPTCTGLGKGEIKPEDKTNPKIIKKYGGYGVDANNDGIADPYDIEDAMYSAANFLAKAGVAKGELKKAIYQYNHSQKYVEDILFYYKQYREHSEELERVALQQANAKK
ncbi:lytic transglycosylase domain-containing protein [Metasolibacillus meyeri]|uniref:Lytic transglycosylase domain-containing protein n=1 Tax=Metasolibacillus meyeri TaxID=1071052 RepID=A0AAW9NFN8_9BACL|nr:lytic transglycosylase domain-containing protein [Metasolibacillus meyeri]MEC1177334.1 lytic transglycosylase domain-containing protein [Metasolibacillus meyeri]